MSKNLNGKLSLIIGYICGVLALFIFPIELAVVGLAFGGFNLVKKRMGHGIAQIIVSGVCGTVGTALKAGYHKW